MSKKSFALFSAAAAVGTLTALLRRRSIAEQEAASSRPVRLGTAKEDRSQQWVPPPKPESSVRERIASEDKTPAQITFLAGITDPVSLTVTIRYDAFRYEWQIHEDYFRVPTSSTQVGFVFGEDVSLQLEIQDFPDASSYEAAMQQRSERFGPLQPVTYGKFSGFSYVDGDVLRIPLRLESREDCCLLVTVIKEHKSTQALADLAGNIDVAEMVSSIETEVM